MSPRLLEERKLRPPLAPKKLPSELDRGHKVRGRQRVIVSPAQIHKMDNSQPTALTDVDGDGRSGPLVVVNNNAPEEVVEDEQADWGPLLEYLKTAHGHEVAGRVIGIIENLQKATLERGSAYAKWDRIIQAAIVAAVLACGTILAALGKFTSEIGIVLVALLGYTLKRN